MTYRIVRVDALTKNAKSTWFALLAALVFVGVTLFSVQPIDFYGVGRATQLPLVGVSVPTSLFFFAAPILTTAVYGYFHLYLIRLWDALSDAPARIDGARLSDVAMPWLITDSALYIRRLLRDDGCTNLRGLDVPNVIWNVFLAWGGGLAVLGFMWWKSLPARDFFMSGVSAISLVFALSFAFGSGYMLVFRMKKEAFDRAQDIRLSAMWSSLSITVIALFLASTTYHQTHRKGQYISQLILTGEQLTQKPEEWLPHRLAREVFFQNWCQNQDEVACTLEDLDSKQLEAFEDAWWSRRRVALLELSQPSWALSGQESSRDFSNASMERVFMSGMFLPNLRMNGAKLTRAQLEGVWLREAHLDNAVLFQASLERSDLQRARLRNADMQGARIAYANLRNARLQRSDLRGANLLGADLYRAELANVDLRGADLVGANLTAAIMINTNLGRSNLKDAELSVSRLDGANLAGGFSPVNLSGSINKGGAMRRLDIRTATISQKTDFRNTFLDGSVRVSDAFREQMGTPCQWVPERLSEEAFFAHWRGWLQHPSSPYSAYWSLIAPTEYLDVAPIPPSDVECKWQLGPIGD